MDKEPRGKIQAWNWLSDVSDSSDYDLVQVQFKNTRYGFYRNVSKLPLKIGDTVVVEASPGHDVGQVTMVGRLVALQMRKGGGPKDEKDIKRIYRIARQNDLEKFKEAKAREHDTMIKSRKIAESLELKMKIGDVEYQGDGAKAIFYYIADERVDFRKLIRLLADEFHIRIEMKQIGARQEAGRIGGIGPCGRPLCCATWMTHFVSVGTAAARFQDLSMNPQKLAGQCAKLKCCLNYEVDTYMEAGRKMPPKDVPLETAEQTYYHFKNDILAGLVTYSTEKNAGSNLVVIPKARAFEIIAMNKQGEKPDSLLPDTSKKVKKQEFVEIVGQDELTRFDKAKKKKKKKPKNKAPGATSQKQPQDTGKTAPAKSAQNAPQQGNGKPRRNGPKGKPKDHQNKKPENEG